MRHEQVDREFAGIVTASYGISKETSHIFVDGGIAIAPSELVVHERLGICAEAQGTARKTGRIVALLRSLQAFSTLGGTSVCCNADLYKT